MVREAALMAALQQTCRGRELTPGCRRQSAVGNECGCYYYEQGKGDELLSMCCADVGGSGTARALGLGLIGDGDEHGRLVVMARRQCERGGGGVDAWLCCRQLEQVLLIIWSASGQAVNTAMSVWRCSLLVLVETPLRGGGEARFA